MTTAAYVRVSTQRQKDNDSHIRQEELIKDYCDKNDWNNVIFYRDIAESGQKLDRDEYSKMMNNLDNIDRVIVRELSRFGRDLIKIIEDIEELNNNDVEFISIKEDFDTSTAMGKAMLRIVGVFYELQADLAREHQIAEIERRKEKGLNIGRKKKLNNQQIDKVIEWNEKGYSYRAITLLVEDEWDIDISQQTIRRYIKGRENGT